MMVAGLTLLGATCVTAADWPQWRGPQRNAISLEKGLLATWPATGPKLAWQINTLGAGYSTPAVVGDRLYVLSNRGTEDEFVHALSVKEGKTLWSTRLGKLGNPDQQPAYPAARTTPTVEGAVLYALGSDGDLACVETATGKIRWKKSLRGDFGGQPGVWAYSESPLVDGDALICTPGGAEATLVALNKKTGAVIWKSAVPGGDQASYASPIVVEVGGVRQYVQFLQKGLVGVEAKTGKFLWRYEKTALNSLANIPTPVAYQDMVYSSSSRGGGGLVRLKVEQGAVTATPVYAAPKLPTSIGGSVRVGDYLYGTTSGGLMCVHFATGEVKWQERGIGVGSIAFADGNLYLLGETGQVALVEASPEGYHEKGRFTLPNQPDRGKAQIWTYPVIANGRLYLRDNASVWAYDIKQ